MSTEINIQKKIIQRFFDRLEDDESVNIEIIQKIKDINDLNKLDDIELILKAISESVACDDKNSEN